MITNGHASLLLSTTTQSREPSPTLADVIARLDLRPDLPQQRRHDLTSAVRRIASLLGQRPEDIVADAAAIRQRLAPFTAAGAGMSRGRWRNVRSLFTVALQTTGVRVMRRRLRQVLTPPWLDLLRCIPDRYERFRLSRLAGFCAVQGIAPEQVNDTVLAAFGADLLRHSLIDRPKQVHREACLAWNRCAATITGWPQIRFRVPENRRDYALPLSAYPPSFGSDVAAYLTHLAGTDLFAEIARRPARPITLKATRLRLMQIAAALVHTGRDPASIRSLADLVAIDAAKQALAFFWERNGKRKTGQLHHFARLITNIGKHWCRVPPDHLAHLQAMRRQVDPGTPRLTARNRARLLQFEDPENVVRLLALPEKVARRVGRSDPVAYNDAVRLQSVVAIAIVLAAPMRVKNLASLTLDRHLVRTRAGGDAMLHLVIPATEVKNDVGMEFPLPPDVRELLDLYLRRVRPLLSRDPSPFLFPARQGGAKTAAQLAAQIQRALKQETGLDLNIHAFRHLCALLFLRHHPGDYETVRQLLGHKSLATTVGTYCGLEQKDALRRYDAVLDKLRGRGQVTHAE